MKHDLYPWQEDCLKKWFANDGRGMVQAVTGSGKTLLALTAAERLRKKLPQELRVKIVVPTGALMRQWHHALKIFLADAAEAESMQKSDAPMQRPAAAGQKIGLRGAGWKSPSDCPYMIYVINSCLLYTSDAADE